MNRKMLPLFVASALFIGYLTAASEATVPSVVTQRVQAQKKKGEGKATVNLAPGTVSHIVVLRGDDKFKPGITTVKSVKDTKNGFTWTAVTIKPATEDKIEIQLTKRAFTDSVGGDPPSGDLTVTLQNSDGTPPPEVEPMPVQYTNDPPFRSEGDDTLTGPSRR